MTPDTQGLVGLLLFGGLLLHCLRQYHLLSSISAQHMTLFLQIKKYFHISFALNCLLEVIFSISLLVHDGEYVRWGYASHLMGLYCNIVAFLLVIRLWNHVLASQRLLPVKNHYYLIFLTMNFISMLLDLIVYCIYGEGDMSAAASVVAVVANVVYVVSLFVASCVLLWYGLDLRSKLSESSSGTSKSLQALLRRINVSLLLFTFCYGIRICGVAYITLETVELGSTGHLLWVLVSFWIPMLGTGVIFLYIMHFSPRTTASSSPLQSSSASASSSSREMAGTSTSTSSSTSTVGELPIPHSTTASPPLALSPTPSPSEYYSHFSPSPSPSLSPRLTSLSVDREEENPLRQNRMFFYSSDSVLS